MQCIKSLDKFHNLAFHSEILGQLMAVDVNIEFGAVESTATKDLEALAMPYLHSVSKIRDELRRIAPEHPTKKQIRDTDLTKLGVYLDDPHRSNSSPRALRAERSRPTRKRERRAHESGEGESESCRYGPRRESRCLG